FFFQAEAGIRVGHVTGVQTCALPIYAIWSVPQTTISFARELDRDEVEAAVNAIAKAKLIVVCGTDQMAFFASYLRHLLMLLDFRVELVASPSQEGLARLARLDNKSLLVGFSAGRPSPLVVRAMRLARHRAAATIAIADATLSELARYADQRLYYSSNSPSF